MNNKYVYMYLYIHALTTVTYIINQCINKNISYEFLQHETQKVFFFFNLEQDNQKKKEND